MTETRDMTRAAPEQPARGRRDSGYVVGGLVAGVLADTARVGEPDPGSAAPT